MNAPPWARTVDAISDHISILDTEGRIVAANKSMRERFEPVHGALDGLDHRVCYCGAATPSAQALCAGILTGGAPIETEGPLPALDGWFRVTSYPLYDDAGTQSGAVLVVRDETARRQMQLALDAAQGELAASRGRTEFFSRMSHELHTPLNAILGFAQVMDTPGRQPEDAENVRQILAAGGHLLRLVDALLGIAGAPGATLPDTAATPAGSTGLPPPPEAAGSRHQMVLYVEDNEANLRLMKRVLARRPGIALLHTSLGRRGVELAREHRPNLILLDLHLPDMSGDDVLAQMLRDPVTRDTPVVIVSADATIATSERLRRAGAADFLVKPFQLAQVLSVMDRLVNERPSAAGETT